jgi:hypothetical protein
MSHRPFPAQWLRDILAEWDFKPLTAQHAHLTFWQASPRAKMASGIASKLTIRRMVCARRIRFPQLT